MHASCPALALGSSLVAWRTGASYCTDTDVATSSSAPYMSHCGAYAGLACLEEHFIAPGMNAHINFDLRLALLQ
jgi:hypothetical protein